MTFVLVLDVPITTQCSQCGAWMSLHVDVLPTHVLSAILQVIADNVENLNIALQCTEMTSI